MFIKFVVPRIEPVESYDYNKGKEGDQSEPVSSSSSCSFCKEIEVEEVEEELLTLSTLPKWRGATALGILRSYKQDETYRRVAGYIDGFIRFDSLISGQYYQLVQVVPVVFLEGEVGQAYEAYVALVSYERLMQNCTGHYMVFFVFIKEDGNGGIAFLGDTAYAGCYGLFEEVDFLHNSGGCDGSNIRHTYVRITSATTKTEKESGNIILSFGAKCVERGGAWDPEYSGVWWDKVFRVTLAPSS